MVWMDGFLMVNMYWEGCGIAFLITEFESNVEYWPKLQDSDVTANIQPAFN
jgi:hypothetical protein